MANLPIDLNRNSALSRPLSFGEVDANFNTINTSINNIQTIDDTINGDYELTFDEAGKLLLIDSSLATVTITIPDVTTTDFSIGQHIDIVQMGTNPVVIAGDKNAVINSFNSKYTIGGQYVGVTIIKINTNDWLLIGNLV